jgi:hypothetical protein
VPLPLGVLRPTFEDIVLVRKVWKYGESVVGNWGWKKAEGSGYDGKVIKGGVTSVAVF